MKNFIWIVMLALAIAVGRTGFAQNPNAEKGKEKKDVEQVQAKDESGQKPDQGKGKGYGMEKGGMAGKEFGMKRSMEARQRLHQNVASAEERLAAQENRLAALQERLAKAKENFEKNKKSGLLKGDALKQKEEKLKMAEEKIRMFEAAIIRHIERVDQRKSQAMME